MSVVLIEREDRSVSKPHRRRADHGTIYTLSDPRTGRVRYVGKTHSIARDRFKRHLCDARKGAHYKVSRWTRGLLSKELEPIFTSIETCAHEVTAEREEFWIAYYRSAGAELLNQTDGGGSLGFTISEETRSKISAANKGRIIDGEWLERLREANGKRRDPSKPRSRFRSRLTEEEENLGHSERMKRRWSEHREEMLAVTAKARAAADTHSPEARSKRSASLREVWQRPGERERRGAAISAAKRKAAACR